MQSPGSARLWRPAAQRHVRNAWAAMQAGRAAWASASSALFQTASALLNLTLSIRFMATMDLGVLKDMDGICQKARAKMIHQQEGYVAQLLAKFDDEVRALSEMLQASKSMRAYRAEDGHLIMFSIEPSVDGDLGDGAGAPVFATLPVATFESLAEEIIAMYEAELKLKVPAIFHSCNGRFWDAGEDVGSIPYGDMVLTTIVHSTMWFLTLEIRALLDPKAEIINEGSDELKSFSLKAPDHIANSEFYNLDWNQVRDLLKLRSKEEVQRETYQVYLTALLIDANIDKQRVEEIIAMVNDEMTGRPAISPT